VKLSQLKVDFCSSRSFFFFSNEIIAFFFQFLVVSKVTDSHRILKPDDFKDALDRMRTNVRVKMIEGLSVMELCLVRYFANVESSMFTMPVSYHFIIFQMISMKHQVEIYDGNPFNFEMILRRYLKFSQLHSMMVVDRQVVMKAFENLKV